MKPLLPALLLLLSVARPPTGGASAAADRATADRMVRGRVAVDSVDYAWRVRGLDGRAVPLEAFRGRVIFLNVWATWCRPCVAEMASIQAAADSLAGSDVAFLLVAPQPRGQVERFARRHRLRLPLFLEHDPIPELFGLRALPSSYVIARDGRIAIRRRGAAEWDAPPVLAALRALVAEPPPPQR